MVIKNVVFDIGNVLLRWEPEKIYAALFQRNDFQKHPLSSIVGGELWLDLDRGLFDMEEGIVKASAGNESCRDDIERFFREAPYYFYPIPENVAYAAKLKKAGYSIYLLSNFHKYGFTILKKRFPFFNSFDGGVISWEVKINKPDRRIYEMLLNKYKLKPAETLFIDDMAENVSVAEDLGIKGIHFKDSTDLTLELKDSISML